MTWIGDPFFFLGRQWDVSACPSGPQRNGWPPLGSPPKLTPNWTWFSRLISEIGSQEMASRSDRGLVIEIGRRSPSCSPMLSCREKICAGLIDLQLCPSRWRLPGVPGRGHAPAMSSQLQAKPELALDLCFRGLQRAPVGADRQRPRPTNSRWRTSSKRKMMYRGIGLTSRARLGVQGRAIARHKALQPAW